MAFVNILHVPAPWIHSMKRSAEDSFKTDLEKPAPRRSKRQKKARDFLFHDEAYVSTLKKPEDMLCAYEGCSKHVNHEKDEYLCVEHAIMDMSLDKIEEGARVICPFTCKDGELRDFKGTVTDLSMGTMTVLFDDGDEFDNISTDKTVSQWRYVEDKEDKAPDFVRAEEIEDEDYVQDSEDSETSSSEEEEIKEEKSEDSKEEDSEDEDFLGLPDVPVFSSESESEDESEEMEV